MNTMNPVSAFLFWICAADKELIAKCSYGTRLKYHTLGLLFAANLVVLSLAWVKVCVHYFGWVGVLPGLLIPTVFVLGLDRLIASSGRQLRGALARYNIEPHHSRGEHILRILMAAALCCTTTFNLQLWLSKDLIAEQALLEAKAANAPLRAEYTDSLAAVFSTESRQLEGLERGLTEQRLAAQQARDHARSLYSQAERTAREARREQFSEAGGLDGRQLGEGPRYAAQQQIADLNQRLAEEAQANMRAAEQKLEKVDAELNVVRSSLIDIRRDHNTRLGGVNDSIKEDPRYVPVRRDLYSDASIYLNLFSDPQWAKGMWVTAIKTYIILLSLELAALMGLGLLPRTEYDVHHNTRIIAESARAGSSPELADLIAEIRGYQAFNPDATQDFAVEAIALQEKVLRAKLERLNAELRSLQAQAASSLGLHIKGKATVATASNDSHVQAPAA